MPMLERVEQLQSCMESMRAVLAEAIKAHPIEEPVDARPSKVRGQYWLT
jgi:hypothetical protein